MIILVAFPAGAGTIRMRTSVATKITGNLLTVTVRVRNTGNDSASKVAAAVEVRGVKATRRLSDKLRSGQGAERAITFPLNNRKGPDRPNEPNGPNGWFPVICETMYRDDQDNTFSIMTVTRYAFKGLPAELDLYFQKPGEPGKSTSLALLTAGRQQRSIVITNRSAGTRNIAVRLVHAQNIRLVPEKSSITLEPKQKGSLALTITNRSFNPNSTTRIHAVAEYDEGERHYTKIVSLPVTIKTAGNVFQRMNRSMIGIALLLVIILAGINLWEWKREKRKEKRPC